MTTFFGINGIDVVGGVVIQSIIPGAPLDNGNKASLATTGRVLLSPGDVITFVNGVPASMNQLLHLDAVLPAGTTVKVDAIATSFGNIPFFIFLTLGAGGVVAFAPGAGGGQPNSGGGQPNFPGGGQPGFPGGGQQGFPGGGQQGHP